MMYAETVPSQGGETHFCDMYGAYDQLEENLKSELAAHNAIHNLDFSRTRRMKDDLLTEEQKASVPPVAHPIFRTHPETQRTCIFLGDHAETVEGMDYEEGRALIDKLNQLATPEALIYRHKWKPGQVVVWDNRCLLHKALPYDTAKEARVIRRCTTLGEVPH